MSLLQTQFKLLVNILLTNFKKAKSNSSSNSCIQKSLIELIIILLQTYYVLWTSYKHIINLLGTYNESLTNPIQTS
jgi:hypothetical protein